MKAFEKWWQAQNESADDVGEALAERAWRAALEWAKSKAFSDTFESFHNWQDKNANHDVIAVTDIEDELGDTNV